jgi:hypothetical protein
MSAAIDVGMNRRDGRLTIAVLVRNTLAAAHARAGLAPPDGL